MRRLLALAFLTTACTETPTQIIGVVGSDYVAPTLLSEIRVSTTIGADRVDGHVFTLDTTTLPLSFGVSPGPDGAPDDFLTIELEAHSIDGLLSARRAVLPFVSQRSMVVPLFLAASCRDVYCEEGDTCTENGCAPEALDPATLADAAPGAELEVVPPSAPRATEPPVPSEPPAAPKHLVEVLNLDTTLGAVRSTNITAIDCGADCSELLPASTQLTLEAYPASHAVFEGWSGDCSGRGPCTVSVDDATVIGAQFKRNDGGSGTVYGLTVAIVGGGQGRVYSTPGLVDCPNRCAADFPSGQVVSLDYEVPSQAIFEGWGGDCSGTGTCNVTLDRVRHVEARIRPFTTPQNTNRFDVTGDGFTDLVFAAPRAGPGGRVYVVRSPLSARFDAQQFHHAWEGSSTASFGEALALPGDMDADGYADILVGAPGTSAVHMINGGPALPNRALAPPPVVTGPSGSGFGATIAVLPDLDLDGRPELAIGAPGGAVRLSAVYVFMSATTQDPRTEADASFVLTGEQWGDGFGLSIAWVGDIDGDGRGELAVGAPMAMVDGHRAGRVYVFRAPHQGTIRNAASADWIISGDGPDQGVGTTVAAIGDWNADGRSDFAISAPTIDGVYVYPPMPQQGPMRSGSVIDAPMILNGIGRSGAALAGIGDFTGDGYPDLLVGAPDFGGPGRGAARVYPGGPMSVAADELTIWSDCMDESRCTVDALGTTVAAVGDLDGDGRPDFGVGSLYGGGTAGAPGRGRIAYFASSRNMGPVPSVDDASTVVYGENEGGMCAMMPGAGGRLPFNR